MNTLLLAPELFTTDSGIPRILRLYLKALCDLSGEKDRVRFVTLNDANIDTADLRPYSTPALGRWESCNRSKADFIGSTLELSSETQVLVCGHIAQLPVAWLAGLRRPRMRYALVAHGIEVWRPYTFWERVALRGAWRIFCVSEFTRTEMLKHIRVDPARIVVLPNALDPELAADGVDSNTITTHQPVILTVSRLSSTDRYKGIDHLIEAMPEILKAAPGTKLRIVGRGDDSQRLQNLARTHQLAESVEFAGFVSNEQLRHEFARCTVFALPSEKEGFGLVYLEAMAHGKPCIAADSGGSPEVVNEDCGFVVPYGDVAALTKSCIAALTQRWDAQDISRKTHARFGFDAFRERLKFQLESQ